MLRELSKKFRKTQQDLVEEYIRVNCNIVFDKEEARRFCCFTDTIEFKRPEGVG